MTREEVTTTDPSGAPDQARQPGRREVKAAMRSAPVVVLDALGEEHLKVTSGEHEQVVEAVLSEGAYRAFCEAVAKSAEKSW